MLLQDKLKPETILWIKQYQEELKNPKLKKPKNWYKSAKTVVKNIIT